MTDSIRLYGAPSGVIAPRPIDLPLVTFILTNTNQSEFVGSAIQSIRDQDYPRFEAIIVDESSVDASQEIIASHVNGHPAFDVLSTDREKGHFGAALDGLEIANGAFVTFVKPGEYLMPNYASLHVQAHLALSRTVAVTSGEVVKTAVDGSVLTGGAIDGLQLEGQSRAHAGFRPAVVVPRLSTVSDALFDQLSENVVAFSHQVRREAWQPGAASMFRRFVIEIVRPASTPDPASHLTPEAYFNWLCHAYGGSAQMYVPVATSRVQAEDYRLDSFDARQPRTRDLPNPKARLELAEGVLARAEDFDWRTKGRLWSVLDDIFNPGDGRSAQGRGDYARREVHDLLARHTVDLVRCYGRHGAMRSLGDRVGPKGLESILRTAFGEQGAGDYLRFVSRRLKRKTKEKTKGVAAEARGKEEAVSPADRQNKMGRRTKKIAGKARRLKASKSKLEGKPVKQTDEHRDEAEASSGFVKRWGLGRAFRRRERLRHRTSRRGR